MVIWAKSKTRNQSTPGSLPSDCGKKIMKMERPRGKQHVGRPRRVPRTRHKALVKGTDRLRDGLERKRDAQKTPDLARIARGALCHVKGTARSPQDHDKIQGIGYQ